MDYVLIRIIIGFLTMTLLPVVGFSSQNSNLSNAVIIWTSPSDAKLIEDILVTFKEKNPKVKTEVYIHGPESTLMGLYTNVADMAIMGREMRVPAEFMAFTWVWQYPPTLLKIANTAIFNSRPESTLAVIVNKNNPLTQISTAELEAIFGEEHKIYPHIIRKWGDLNINLKTSHKSIRAISLPIESPSCLYFQHSILADSYKWNSQLEEYADTKNILEAVSKDETAIAITPIESLPQDVKIVPVKSDLQQKSIYPSNDAIVAEDYPLSRNLWAIINKKPHTPISANTRLLLEYILQSTTQKQISSHSGYLSLKAETLASQKALLND